MRYEMCIRDRNKLLKLSPSVRDSLFDKIPNKNRRADCAAGSHGTGLFPGAQLHHQSSGPFAVGRIRRRSEDRLFHHVGTVLHHAERFRICSPKHRGGTKRPRQKGIFHRHADRMRRRRRHLLRRIFRRSAAFLPFHRRQGSHCPERRLSRCV